MADEFDVFGAEPVTSDDEDSVRSEVELDEPATTDVDGTTVAIEGPGGSEVP